MVRLGLSNTAWYAQIQSPSCIWLSWLKYFNKLVCHARRKCTYAGFGSTQTLQTNSLPNPCFSNWNYPGPAVWDSKRVPKVTLAFIMESQKSKPFNTIYTPENEHIPWKRTISIGTTSSNHGFSGDILGFRGGNVTKSRKQIGNKIVLLRIKAWIQNRILYLIKVHVSILCICNPPPKN